MKAISLGALIIFSDEVLPKVSAKSLLLILAHAVAFD
ncbi:MAG: hypothetical protein ACI910_003148 [Oleispira sp.]|jgi:hypothetical protein